MSPVPKREMDRTGAEMNAYWREQQARLRPKPAEKPRQAPAAADKPAGLPKQPQGQTPQVCQGCDVHKDCRAVLKLWARHTPRPDLCRAWDQHIKKNRAAMPCILDAAQDEHRLDLRREK